MISTLIINMMARKKSQRVERKKAQKLDNLLLEIKIQIYMIKKKIQNKQIRREK